MELATKEYLSESENFTWSDILAEEKKKTYFIDIIRYIESRRAKGVKVYPKNSEIFNAFKLYSIQRYKSCNYRTGSVSRLQPGTRAILFC